MLPLYVYTYASALLRASVRTYQNSLWWTWHRRRRERTSCSTLLSSFPPFNCLKSWALTQEKCSPLCVCQCVCETVPYFMLLIIAGVIFLLASGCLMKKQLWDVFVWFAVMRWDSWKQLWCCDRLYTRIWYAVCVFHLNVLLLSVQLIHWLIASVVWLLYIDGNR